MGRLIDLTGRVFGKLTVEGRHGCSYVEGARWLCRCECGGTKVVASGSLRRGCTKSCGCIKRGAPKGVKYPHRARRARRTVEVVGQKYVKPVAKKLRGLTLEQRVWLAFEAARARREPPHRCYIAAVQVWHAANPSVSREYAGKQAVEIVLDRRVRALFEETRL